MKKTGFNIGDYVNSKGELTLPRTVPDYSSKKYWNNRYIQEEGLSFDWLESYETLKHILLIRLYENKEAEILMLGCGNSLLSENLYEEGYHYITNIDFSQVVIQQMKKRYEHYQDMDFHVMDVCESIDIEDNYMNLVIDKGTLDCIICGPNNYINIMRMLEHIYRILMPGGVYICISHGKPETRCTFLSNPKFNWEVEIQALSKIPLTKFQKLEGSQCHYAFICTKRIESD